MSKWPMVRLGDVCEVNPRTNVENLDIEVSFVPMSCISENGTLELLETRSFTEVKNGFTTFQDRDVIFAKITPCMENGKGAIVDRLCNGVGAGSTEFHVIRPDQSKVLSEWIFLFTKWDHFREEAKLNMTGSAGQKRVPKKFLSEHLLPLPPLETQKKIADVLDKAKSLIDLRKKQIERMDMLIKSKFIEMFGDPVRNPKGWRVTLFTEVATIDTHMTTDWEKYNDLPHVGIENIEKDTGHITKLKLVRDSELISGKYIFDKRHIIYSKIRPNLNKVALPDFTGVCSADAYPILPKSNTTRYYLAYILRNQLFLDYILSYSDRTNIPKVNKKQLSGFQLPLPPIEDQNYFTVFVKSVEKQKNQLQQALDKMEMNYKSMMQKYFR